MRWARLDFQASYKCLFLDFFPRSFICLSKKVVEQGDEYRFSNGCCKVFVQKQMQEQDSVTDIAFYGTSNHLVKSIIPGLQHTVRPSEPSKIDENCNILDSIGWVHF